ncbi:auxin efflux carrier [Catenaria anguillulae PL171]|uniref:Auxin efflux carrier n=1 Tax=Catenaria anguillulae PL171 TaxID=765915 RepID=A0A1Y2HL10_9FUNG|nr:auxin efflux carrier [Catenaria anguillulae PL171]
MSSSSIGTYIFAAARAVLKVALVCGAGAISFKSGMFDEPSMKLMSKLYVQVLIPSLLFSKTALAITPTNAPYLGQLIGVSVLYLAIGHLAGFVIYRMLINKLPRHFRRTIIPMAAYGNSGDLVLSILASVGNEPPFNKGDQALGVAFVAIFLASFNIVFFSSATAHFAADVAHLVEAEEVAMTPQESRNPSLELDDGPASSSSASSLLPEGDVADIQDQEIVPPSSSTFVSSSASASNASPSSRLSPEVKERPPATPPPRAHAPNAPLNSNAEAQHEASPSTMHTIRRIWLTVSTHPLLSSLLNLPNIGLFSGLLVALIPGALPLMVPTSSAPLSFIYSAFDFLGQAAVPLSLTIFGASLTTLETDRRVWREYPGIPWALILVLVFRLILMPVIGIVVVEVILVGALGWIPKEEKMLRFVLMIEAAVPTAQLVLIMAKYYHPQGEAKEAAAMTLAQYAVCFLTLTASLAFILNLLS